MGIFCRLVHGAKEFQFEDANHSLGPDFVPPAVIEQSILSGSQGNEGAYEIDSMLLDRDWTFTIRIRGDSKAEIEMEFRRLVDFLRLSKDRSETLYIEYLSNTNYAAKLVWGSWGGPLKYIVKRASVALSPQYNLATAVNWKMIGENPITLTIGPLAETKEFKVGNALGGILEDYWFTRDGASRGLIIPEATTNKFTDPVCNAAWTAEVGIIDAENTDPRYCLPGRFTSRHLIGKPGAAPIYWKAINVGNENKHSFSAYVKKSDGSEVKDTDIYIWYYNLQNNNVYQHLGNGVYLVYMDNITGFNAATATGIVLGAGVDIYLLGYQVEEKTYHTELCYGDLLGCAWTGTAHASTSIRTSARCRFDGANTYSPGQGTIIIAWKAPSIMNYANFMIFTTNNNYLFLMCDWVHFFFSDGTNFTDSHIMPEANTIYVFHCTYGKDGLKFYINGICVGTCATFMPRAIEVFYYLGTNYDITMPSRGTFLDFHTLDYPLTQAEITADATNIYQHVAGGDGLGQRLGGIPWHWTVAGGGLYDSHTDSGHQNWGVVGGIPGSAPAKTAFNLATAGAVYTTYGLYLSNCTINHFFKPNGNLFFDLSGTADAGACGGEVLRTAVNDWEIEIGTGAPSRLALSELYDKTLNLMVRLKIATANDISLFWKMALIFTVGQSKIMVVSAGTSFRGWILKNLYFPGKANFMQGYATGFYTPLFKLLAYLTGGPKDVDVDYIDVFPEATLYISGPIYDGNAIIYRHPDAQRLTSNQAYGKVDVSGHEISLNPHKFNLLQLLARTSTDFSMGITSTFNWISITPRYMLL